MTGEPEGLTPSESRAREAVRSLAPPLVDPAFRERAKRDFLAGVPARGRVPLPRPRPALRPAWWVVAPALALAAIALVVLPSGPAWRVVSADGEGAAIVDHRPIPLAHTADLARALKPGARIGVGPDTRLELELKGHLALQVTPGTELVLPGPPRGWSSHDMRAVVWSGEVRITTEASFAGDRLTIETPEAAVLVTGTTLAVIRDAEGTCVCVCEGTVEVGPRGGPMARVTRDRRRFVFRDGRPPEDAAIREVEGVELVAFRNRHRARLEGRASDRP